jgi:tetratricopeptide (TPR) repeat protein
MEREDYEEALPHFQRVVEIDPNFANGWYNIGQAQQGLDDDEGAKDSYRRAIELESTNVMAYTELADIYVEADEIPEARKVLQQGVQANPESAELLTLLSATYIDSDLRRAEELLEQAENLDPDMEIVQMYRQIINMRKQAQRLPSGKKPKPKKKR